MSPLAPDCFGRSSDASITFRPRLSGTLLPPPTRLPCGGLSPSSPPPIPQTHHPLYTSALARHRQPRHLHTPAASRQPHLQPEDHDPPLVQRRQCRLSRLLSPRLPPTRSRSPAPLRLLRPSPPPRLSLQTPTAASAPTLRPATPPRATLRLRSPSTSRRARLPTDLWMRMQRLKWPVCRIQMVAAGSRASPT